MRYRATNAAAWGPVRVWNPRTDWVISPDRTHPALVSDEDFTAAQEISAQAVPNDGQQRQYALTGLLICGICGRRLSGHWVNGRPGYRCRHGRTSAHPTAEDAPRWVYWSQDRLVEHLTAAETAPAALARAGGAAAVATYLRRSDAVVVCGHGSVAIQAAGEQLISTPAARGDHDGSEPNEPTADELPAGRPGATRILSTTIPLR